MKNFYLFSIVLFLSIACEAQDTFSICAVDTITGEVGSAGASCIGAPQISIGCYILSDVIPGVGVIHTQAYYLAANQNYAHQLMLDGLNPQQIVDSLVANDVQNNPGQRQYGVVNFNQFTSSASCAAYTGANCDDYKNHIIGPNYTIQGNILLGQQILDSMEAQFLATEGELACKLMAAMQGAKVIGADTRCLDDGVSSLSSFLRVAQPSDPLNNLYLDFNVPSTPVGVDPIDSLQTLMDDWGACLTSGNGDINNKKTVSIYPNPAKNILIIDGTSNYSFVLKDITGKEVFSNPKSSNNKVSIPDYIKNGLYFYIIIDDKGEINKGKIIIQGN